MSDALTRWLEQLSTQPLPVGQASRDALRALAEKGNYNGPALTRALAHDPLLCAQLLRMANDRPSHSRVATLEQAAVLLGARRLTDFAARLPVQEQVLEPADLLALRQLIRRGFHVGYLARELTRRFRDAHFDDAFYAGSLHHLGELALRVHSPRVIPQIRRTAQRRAIPLGEAAVEVLGFEIPKLGALLAERWRLPELICAVLNTGHAAERRVELIRLAAALVQAGAEALQPERDSPLLKRLGQILLEPVEDVRVVVFKAANEAAAHLAPRLPAATATLGELFPAEPVDRHDDEPRTAAPTPRPEFLDRFEALASSRENDLPLQQLLERFTSALREGLGLDRVVFAVLTPDQANLRGRFYRGVGPDSSLHRFEFAQTDGNLFNRLMERPGAAWVTRRSPAQIQALLTPNLKRVVDAPEFLVQSIFQGNRPLGLCYADRGSSGRPLTAQDYALFKQNCASLAGHLAKVAKPPG